MAHLKVSRDMRLDFMRALGTLTIIVPHVLSPNILVQIRAFDVVMLVFVSGMSYAYQVMNGQSFGYYQYIKKRCKKLLIPTIVLILVIYCSVNIVSIVLSKRIYYSIQDLMKSLLLFEDGIGYVWIIKVYLGLALIAPFVWKFIKKIDSNIFLLVFCSFAYIIYLMTQVATQNINIPIFSVFFKEYVFYVAAYAIPFLIGMYICKIGKRKKCANIIWILLFVVVQIIIVLRGGGFTPNDNKYPPQLYYLSYGIACSIIIYRIAPTRVASGIKWLSKNSLVFYLVHVFWIIWISLMANSLNIQFINIFWIKYILVVLLTALTTLGINRSFTLFKEKSR